MNSIRCAAGFVILALSVPAFADVPQFTATCPGGTQVSADQHGKVSIGGDTAKVKSMGASAWQAHANGITVDIGRDGAQVFVGISPAGDLCEVTSSHAAGNADGSIGGVPLTDQKACLKAVSHKTNNKVVSVLNAISSQANNNVTIGVGADKAKWQCLVKDAKVAEVMSMTDEGTL
jgi:hypothetical protein